MKILAAPAFSNKNANPYNFLLYVEMAAYDGDVHEYSHRRFLKNRYDVVHYHWPDGYINHPSLLKTFWRMAVMLASVAVCKIRRTAIIWTVHNVAPHDPHYPRLAHGFLTFFSHNCAGLIFLSRYSQNIFFKIYPAGKKSPATSIIAHGHYKTIYPPPVAKNEARAKLGLNAKASVLLFFGQIKPYKNMEALLAAFGDLKDEHVYLVVAGKPSSNELRDIVQLAAAADKRVMPALSFIPDSDIPIYMAAADCIVLPYRAILNSGAVMLALSYGVPVLVPALGSMRELQDEVGKDWIYLYDGNLDADDLKAALTQNPSGTFDYSAYEWRDIAKKTLDLYRTAIRNF